APAGLLHRRRADHLPPCRRWQGAPSPGRVHGRRRSGRRGFPACPDRLRPASRPGSPQAEARAAAAAATFPAAPTGTVDRSRVDLAARARCGGPLFPSTEAPMNIDLIQIVTAGVAAAVGFLARGRSPTPGPNPQPNQFPLLELILKLLAERFRVALPGQQLP